MRPQRPSYQLLESAGKNRRFEPNRAAPSRQRLRSSRPATSTKRTGPSQFRAGPFRVFRRPVLPPMNYPDTAGVAANAAPGGGPGRCSVRTGHKKISRRSRLESVSGADRHPDGTSFVVGRTSRVLLRRVNSMTRLDRPRPSFPTEAEVGVTLRPARGGLVHITSHKESTHGETSLEQRPPSARIPRLERRVGRGIFPREKTQNARL